LGNQEPVGDADISEYEPVSDKRIIELLTSEVEMLRRRNEEMIQEDARMKRMALIMAGLDD